MFKLRLKKAISLLIVASFCFQDLVYANPDFFIRQKSAVADTLAPSSNLKDAQLRSAIKYLTILINEKKVIPENLTSFIADKLKEFPHVFTPSIAQSLIIESAHLEGGDLRMDILTSAGKRSISYPLLGGDMIFEQDKAKPDPDKGDKDKGMVSKDGVLSAEGNTTSIHEGSKTLGVRNDSLWGKIIRWWNKSRGKWELIGAQGVNDVIREYWKTGQRKEGCAEPSVEDMAAIIAALKKTTTGPAIADLLQKGGFHLYIYDLDRREFVPNVRTHAGIRTGSIHITKMEYEHLKKLGPHHLAARLAHEVSEVSDWRALAANNLHIDLGVVKPEYDDEWAVGIRKWIRDHWSKGQGPARMFDNAFHTKGRELEISVLVEHMFMALTPANAQTYYSDLALTISYFKPQDGRFASFVTNPDTARFSGNQIFDSIIAGLRHFSDTEDRKLFITTLTNHAALGQIAERRGGIVNAVSLSEDFDEKTTEILILLKGVRDILRRSPAIDILLRTKLLALFDEIRNLVSYFPLDKRNVVNAQLAALASAVSENVDPGEDYELYRGDPADNIVADSRGATSTGLAAGIRLGGVTNNFIAEQIRPQAKTVTTPWETPLILLSAQQVGVWSIADINRRIKALSTTDSAHGRPSSTSAEPTTTTRYRHISRLKEQTAQKVLTERMDKIRIATANFISDDPYHTIRKSNGYARIFCGSATGYFDTADKADKQDAYSHSLEITVITNGALPLHRPGDKPRSETEEEKNDREAANKKVGKIFADIGNVGQAEVKVVGVDTLKSAIGDYEKQYRQGSLGYYNSEWARLFNIRYHRMTGNNVQFSDAVPEDQVRAIYADIEGKMESPSMSDGWKEQAKLLVSFKELLTVRTKTWEDADKVLRKCLALPGILPEEKASLSWMYRYLRLSCCPKEQFGAAQNELVQILAQKIPDRERKNLEQLGYYLQLFQLGKALSPAQKVELQKVFVRLCREDIQVAGDPLTETSVAVGDQMGLLEKAYIDELIAELDRVAQKRIDAFKQRQQILAAPELPSELELKARDLADDLRRKDEDIARDDRRIKEREEYGKGAYLQQMRDQIEAMVNRIAPEAADQPPALDLTKRLGAAIRVCRALQKDVEAHQQTLKERNDLASRRIDMGKLDEKINQLRESLAGSETPADKKEELKVIADAIDAAIKFDPQGKPGHEAWQDRMRRFRAFVQQGTNLWTAVDRYRQNVDRLKEYIAQLPEIRARLKELETFIGNPAWDQVRASLQAAVRGRDGLYSAALGKAQEGGSEINEQDFKPEAYLNEAMVKRYAELVEQCTNLEGRLKPVLDSIQELGRLRVQEAEMARFEQKIAQMEESAKTGEMAANEERLAGIDGSLDDIISKIRVALIIPGKEQVPTEALALSEKSEIINQRCEALQSDIAFCEQVERQIAEHENTRAAALSLEERIKQLDAAIPAGQQQEKALAQIGADIDRLLSIGGPETVEEDLGLDTVGKFVMAGRRYNTLLRELEPYQREVAELEKRKSERDDIRVRKAKADQEVAAKKRGEADKKQGAEDEIIYAERRYEVLCKRIEDALHGQTITPGMVVDGQYRIREALDRGGFGAVFKAEYTQQFIDQQPDPTEREKMKDRKLAIKFLMPRAEVSSDQHKALEDRFMYECKIHEDTTKANAPVPKYRGKGNYAGFHYLAMDFVDGMPLDNLIRLVKDGTLRLSLREKVALLWAISKVLRKFHVKEFMHRDFKPAQFIIPVKRDRIKIPEINTPAFDTFVESMYIVDLGTARRTKQVGGEADFAFKDVRAITQTGANITQETGALPFSPQYMSPEQAKFVSRLHGLQEEPEGRSNVLTQVAGMIRGRGHGHDQEQAVPAEPAAESPIIIGVESDIAQVGTAMYELLAHDLPYKAASPLAYINLVGDDKQMPRMLRATVAQLNSRMRPQAVVTKAALEEISKGLADVLCSVQELDKRVILQVGDPVTFRVDQEVITAGEKVLRKRLTDILWLKDSIVKLGLQGAEESELESQLNKICDNVMFRIFPKIPEPDAHLELLIMAMLRKKPEDRPKIHEIDEEFRKWLNNDQASMMYQPAVAKKEKGAGFGEFMRRRAPAIALFLAGMLGVLGYVYVKTRQKLIGLEQENKVLQTEIDSLKNRLEFPGKDKKPVEEKKVIEEKKPAAEENKPAAEEKKPAAEENKPIEPPANPPTPAPSEPKVLPMPDQSKIQSLFQVPAADNAFNAPDHRLINAVIECAILEDFVSQVDAPSDAEVAIVALGSKDCHNFMDVYSGLQDKDRVFTRFKEMCAKEGVGKQYAQELFNAGMQRLKNVSGHAGLELSCIYVVGKIENVVLLKHEISEMQMHQKKAAELSSFPSWESVPPEKQRDLIQQLRIWPGYNEFALKAHQEANSYFPVSGDEIVADETAPQAGRGFQAPIAAVKKDAAIPAEKPDRKLLLDTLLAVVSTISSVYMNVFPDSVKNMPAGKLESSKKGVILFVDDLVDNDAAFDLDKLARITGAEGSAIGKIVLFARNAGKADLVEALIKKANPKADVKVVLDSDIKAQNERYYSTPILEAVIRYCLNQKSGIFSNQNDIIGVVRGPLKKNEDPDALRKELTERSLRVPVVAFEKYAEGNIYSVTQAVSELISMRLEDGRATRGFFFILPAITKISESIREQYATYKRMLDVLTNL